MIELQDTVEIQAPPERIFEWLTHLSESYSAWHPDHVSCRHHGPITTGSTLEVEEYLHGRLHRMRMSVTEVVPPRRILYRVGPFASGGFLVQGANGVTTFTAYLWFGSSRRMPAAILDPIMRLLFGRRLAALREHMAEEGKNLKRLLESTG